MKGSKKKSKKLLCLSLGSKVIIILVVSCLLIGGLSPNINSLIINDSNETNDNDKSEPENEMKKSGYYDNDIYASFTWNPKYPDPGEQVTFRSTSYSYDGYIMFQKWYFPDGKTYSGRIATHTFEKKGNYQVTLFVRSYDYDEHEYDSDYRTSTVKVGADPFPKITCTPPDPSPGESVVLDSSESTDPDGNIVSYNWSFYDTSDPQNITYLGTSSSVNHVWPKQGIYVVILYIEDDKGNNNTIEKTIHVSILKIRGFPKRYRGLKFEISNHGNVAANNVEWTVEIFKDIGITKRHSRKGRSLYKKSGTESTINAGSDEDIKITKYRRRFCKIILEVNASADNAVQVTKTYHGLMYGKILYLSEKNIGNPIAFIKIIGLFVILLLIFMAIT